MGMLKESLLLQGVHRYWPEALAGVATVLVLMTAVALVHTHHRLSQDVSALPNQPSAANPTGGLSDLVSEPYFGTAVQPSTAVPASVSLVLVGTLASSQAGHGYALIGPTAQSVKTYAVQDALPGGARLIEVYADHVILENGGRQEQLNLPHATPINTPVANNSSAPKPDTFQNTLQKVQSDPTVLAEVLKPMPQFEGGHLKGFKAFPGNDRTRFEKLGLKPGDLITQVNNVPFTDPANGLEMLKSLSSAQSAALTIDRDGQMVSLTIDANQLNAATNTPPRPMGAPNTTSAQTPVSPLVPPTVPRSANHFHP
jgi:general secretion pathway protein C